MGGAVSSESGIGGGGGIGTKLDTAGGDKVTCAGCALDFKDSLGCSTDADLKAGSGYIPISI